MVSNKEEHDRLLALKPSEANHEDCIYCKEQNHPGGDVKTYDETEFTEALSAAVELATAPLKEELATLKSSQAQADVEGQIAALKTQHETEVNAIRAELDVANVAKSAAETAVAEAAQGLADLEAYLQGEADALAEAELAKARIDSRTEAVKEFNLDEDYVTAQVERWSKMSDEDFANLTETLRVVAGKAPANLEEVPLSTAMSGNRPASTKASAVSGVFGLIRAGVDPRNS